MIYCDDCNGYQPIGMKAIICIDCGKEVEVDSKDNETCRCEECRRIYIRERDRLRKQRYRKKCPTRNFKVKIAVSLINSWFEGHLHILTFCH